MNGPPGQLDLGRSEALLRKLELKVRNRLDGLLQGNYTGLVPGPGSEAGESRQYVPGDDVRRMDWPVTARTTVPHVRQTVVDRELETWLVVDVSASMDFGTARTEKRELVLAAITAIAHLTVRGGNRIGAIVGDGRNLYRVPALPGRQHARHLVGRIARAPRAEPDTEFGRPGGADLAAMLESLRRPQRRRGLVAVISDYLEPGPHDTAAEPRWVRPLRALSDRHQLIGVEVLDPRELELPAAGLVTFADPESGRQLEVQTSDRAVRERYAAAAAAQRARVVAGLRHAGAAHLQLRTDRDWVTDVVRFVIAQRQLGRGAVGTAVR
jgi:uncharacterized protein (DUF58 family)